MALIKSYTFRLNRKSKSKKLKTNNLKSGNQMINANDTMHYTVAAEIIAYLRQLSIDTVSADLPQDKIMEASPCHVIIKISAPTKRKADAPNWYPTIKPLLDGMTLSGVWEDDNNDVITSLTFVPIPPNKENQYHIIIDIHQGFVGGAVHG